MEAEAGAWRRCSGCKEWIDFETLHWVCNVSTCNRKRTGLVFCSVTCWEVHLPTMNHRESWAVEKDSPSRAEWKRLQAAEQGRPVRGVSSPVRRMPAPVRRMPAPVRSQPAARPEPPKIASETPREVLIIASRLRDYVRARSGMNTSERVLDPLSDILRRVCDEAIRRAVADGRQTLLDRDIPEG